MKPAPFELQIPDTLDEALGILDDAASQDIEARVLAGGQSLVAMMNLRLARPELLVDLNRVSELDHVDVDAGGRLHIGAMTRQRTAERSSVVRDGWPLLAEALPLVAHAPIRNRGTVGGSIAHADPGAELCAVGLALDADAHVRGPSGPRDIALSDFFVGPFMSRLEPGEVLVDVSFPKPAPGVGTSIVEIARRQGDFALAGVAAFVRVSNGRTIDEARIAYISLASRPVRVVEAEQVMVGEEPSRELFEHVADVATSTLEPSGDIHGSAAYRLHVAGVLTRRALATAADRASGGAPDA